MAIRLKPSQREKKRYIGFQILSKSRISSLAKIQKTVMLSMIQYKGEHGLAESGLIVVPERYDPATQCGVVRVNRKRVNDAITALTLTRAIDGAEVVIKTTGTSGMIHKAHKNNAN